MSYTLGHKLLTEPVGRAFVANVIHFRPQILTEPVGRAFVANVIHLRPRLLLMSYWQSTD